GSGLRMNLSCSRSLNGRGWLPSSVRVPLPRMVSRRAEIAAVSTRSGCSPSRPSITALSLPCPLPVAPSEPYSSTCNLAVASSRPSSRGPWAKRSAARIGPTVWELEGPMPILNRSSALRAMEIARGLPWSPQCRAPLLISLDRRTAAHQVAVAVGVVDPRHRRPVLVVHQLWHRIHGLLAAVGMRPVAGQLGGGVRRVGQRVARSVQIAALHGGDFLADADHRLA